MTEPPISPSQTLARAGDGRPPQDVHLTDSPVSNGNISVESDRESRWSSPRWVQVLGIITIMLVLVLALLFGVLQFTGSGTGHGPAHEAPTHSVQLP